VHILNCLLWRVSLVCVCLYVDFVPCLSFATLDPTIDEFEGEYFGDFEDNQFYLCKSFHLYLFKDALFLEIAITS
jgi:hypothetical protein